LTADPRVDVQDGPLHFEMKARELGGEEKAEWWKRAVAAFPDYANYQLRTRRDIPVFVLEPVSA
jgi:deazaflavin-dependent oxidoreductase (nitroreductase family)